MEISFSRSNGAFGTHLDQAVLTLQHELMLAQERGLDWSRVVCFNMDGFWDPSIPEELTCGYQVRRQLYDGVQTKAFHVVQFNAPDPHEEARRFEGVLRSAGPMDILCQGIGTSGHLAFNEPSQTDFQDPAWVKVVDIAAQSKEAARR